jgi:hypothetical protein
MKKTRMAVTMMFALGCFAQSSGGGSSSGSAGSGASSSTGSMGTGGSSGQSGSSSGSMSSGQTTSTDNSSSTKSNSKGDKTLKGCIQSQNGGYALEEKHGKTVMLTGSQDLSAHVGHMVKVHGMWEKGSANSASMSSSGSGSTDNTGTTDHMGSMANSSNGGGSVSKDAMYNSGKKDHNGKSFMVDKVDMVSDQCKVDKAASR